MQAPKPVLAILDDEPEMRKALRRLLTGVGYAVNEYACRNDFIAALPLQPPDCLLLDLHMLEGSGFDVLEDLQNRRSHVPVIIITAHDAPGTEERIRALGACAFLKKPVDQDTLFSAIENARKQTRNNR